MKNTVLIIVTLASLVITSCSNHKQVLLESNSDESGSGEEDNPYDLLKYDSMRLVDPTTGKIPTHIHSREMAFFQSMNSLRKTSASTTNWTPRGPYDVGGRTRSFAMDVSNPNILLAGGVTGGMWRSTDAGQSWTRTTAPDQMHSVSCLAQDTRPGHTNTWYYGTGEQYAVVSAAAFSDQYSGNGLFKSTDDGLTWQPLTSTQSNTPTTLYTTGDFDFVWTVATDPADLNNDDVYAAVMSGIYKSADGGQTWTATLGLDTSLGVAQYSNIMITPGGVKYAAVNGNSAKGLWRSVDGDTWTNIKPSAWPNTFNRVVMAYAPSDENQIYFIAETPGSGTHGHQLWNYTYLSGDGSGSGGQWSNRSSNIPSFGCHYDTRYVGDFNSQNSYDLCMAVKPDNADIVFLGGTNIYRSTTGFTNSDSTAWIGGYICDTSGMFTTVYPNHHPDQHILLFDPNNTSKLFSCNDGGMFYTTDCMSDNTVWQTLNHGYVTSQFYTCQLEQGNVSNDIVIGGAQDNGSRWTNSADDANPWQWILFGDGSYCAITHGHQYYYTSKQQGKVFKTTLNTDGSLASYTRIDPHGAGSYLFIAPFILDPLDDNVMYLAAGQYIWKNDGLNELPITGDILHPIDSNWTRITASNSGLNSQISSIAMSPANHNILYYGTTNGNLFKLDSAANGTATKIDIGDSLPNGYISSIAVDEQDENKILISLSNYKVRSIFYSSNGGANWHHVSGNLEENQDGSGDGPSVCWVSMLNMGDSTIYYAGTSIGLFSTTLLDDSNTVWQIEGENTIGNVVINMIQTRSYDGKVVIATHGNGMYAATLKPVSGIDEQGISSDLNISPNPFTDKVTIEFSLANNQSGALNIYSLSGVRVYSQSLSAVAGKQTFQWDGRNLAGMNLAGGMYLVEIKTAGKSQFAKLVLAR